MKRIFIVFLFSCYIFSNASAQTKLEYDVGLSYGYFDWQFGENAKFLGNSVSGSFGLNKKLKRDVFIKTDLIFVSLHTNGFKDSTIPWNFSQGPFVIENQILALNLGAGIRKGKFELSQGVAFGYSLSFDCRSNNESALSTSHTLSNGSIIHNDLEYIATGNIVKAPVDKPHHFIFITDLRYIVELNKFDLLFGLKMLQGTKILFGDQGFSSYNLSVGARF